MTLYTLYTEKARKRLSVDGWRRGLLDGSRSSVMVERRMQCRLICLRGQRIARRGRERHEGKRGTCAAVPVFSAGMRRLIMVTLRDLLLCSE